LCQNFFREMANLVSILIGVIALQLGLAVYYFSSGPASSDDSGATVTSFLRPRRSSGGVEMSKSMLNSFAPAFRAGRKAQLFVAIAYNQTRVALDLLDAAPDLALDTFESNEGGQFGRCYPLGLAVHLENAKLVDFLLHAAEYKAPNRGCAGKFYCHLCPETFRFPPEGTALRIAFPSADPAFWNWKIIKSFIKRSDIDQEEFNAVFAGFDPSTIPEELQELLDNRETVGRKGRGRRSHDDEEEEDEEEDEEEEQPKKKKGKQSKPKDDKKKKKKKKNQQKKGRRRSSDDDE